MKESEKGDFWYIFFSKTCLALYLKLKYPSKAKEKDTGNARVCECVEGEVQREKE